MCGDKQTNACCAVKPERAAKSCCEETHQTSDSSTSGESKEAVSGVVPCTCHIQSTPVVPAKQADTENASPRNPAISAYMLHSPVNPAVERTVQCDLSMVGIHEPAEPTFTILRI
ncbi:MAG: hypothetical protein AMXMBFR84_49340 [Candidatus Hydrogenedentota bacterium]